MKPAVKYGIIAVAWLLYLVIAISGNSEKDTQQVDVSSQAESVQAEQSGETTAEDTVDTETETAAQEILLDEYIERVVAKYNEQATEELVFVEDFAPSDQASGHYRTEFRLSAYEDAVGKAYLLGDKAVDLVAAPTILGEIRFRVYTKGTSLEQVVELIQVMSPIMDENLTAAELQDTITEVTTKKTANGYYYGELGIVLLGSDAKGYELMIKND